MSIFTKLLPYIITISIFTIVIGSILYIINWPKYKTLAKHKRYVNQLNDYIIMQRPYWFQNLALSRYQPIRYIHVSPRKGMRKRNRVLPKSKVIRELIIAGFEAIDVLPAGYTYIANTHSPIVKQLIKLEREQRIRILSNKKTIWGVSARCAQKTIFGYADSSSFWWDSYTVIFQKVSD